MPSEQNKQQPETPKGDHLRKAKSAVTAKKNRGLVIGAVVLLIGLFGLIYSVNQGDPNEPKEGTTASTPVPVEVPKTPSKQPTTSSDPTEEPSTPGEEPSETPTTTPTDVEEPATIPPGAPKNRGGLPPEFPLDDTYAYANTEVKGSKKVISGTVNDSAAAIKVLDHNLAKNYSVSNRDLDTNGASGHYGIEGPGAPAGTTVVILPDGTFQVRIPQK